MRNVFLALLGGMAGMAETHFHHLQLNVTDPAAVMDFYTSRFACERDGADALRVDSGWLLLRKARRAPAARR